MRSMTFLTLRKRTDFLLLDISQRNLSLCRGPTSGAQGTTDRTHSKNAPLGRPLGHVSSVSLIPADNGGTSFIAGP